MLTRRNVLLAGALAGLGGAGGYYGLAYTARSGSSSAAPQQLHLESGLGEHFDELLLQLEGTDQLARHWFDAQAVVPSPRALQRVITGKLPAGAAAMDAETLDAAVAALVASDFSLGHTCTVVGWMLSETECQLIGLRHLLLASRPDNAPLLASESTSDDPASYPLGEIAPLAEWGPRYTEQGRTFNVQLDGHSGMWFQFDNAPAHARIMIDGELAPTSVSTNLVTSGLFDTLQQRVLANPGQYPVALVDTVRGIRQDIGNFVVRGSSESARPERSAVAEFCKVQQWGPVRTQVGVAANEQPDGAMGIWVKTACLPADTRLLVGDDMVDSGVRSFGLTGSIPVALLGAPGRIPLHLYSAAAEQKKLLGYLTVE